jgi:bifunctional non-homologous end joining protein LigD
MGLQTYLTKRDFERTPEPRGGAAPSDDGHSFVIQEHAARRLHYDSGSSSTESSKAGL